MGHHPPPGAPAAPSPAPHGGGDNVGMNRVMNMLGAPIELEFRRFVRAAIETNSRWLTNLVSFTHGTDGTGYMHFGPQALGVKVPVQLGLKGLVLASGAFNFKNPLVERIVSEGFEVFAFELSDAYREGRAPTGEEVQKAAKKADDRMSRKMKVVMVLDGSGQKILMAHVDDCLERLQVQEKYEKKTTFKQVKEQGIPLALACPRCGKQLIKLREEEEAMADGHAPAGAPKAGKPAKLSAAEALGQYRVKHPNDFPKIASFLGWFHENYPEEAERFLTEVDKVDEWHALAGCENHEQRRVVALSMLKPPSFLGGLFGGHHHKHPPTEAEIQSHEDAEDAKEEARKKGGILGRLLFGNLRRGGGQ